MKTNKRKRGFTIVELVIVIAVIAILAAVLIPTFTGLVEEARQSNDRQIIYYLNEAVKEVEVKRVQDGKTAKASTMHETLEAMDEKGFGVAKLTPTSQKCDIVWDSSTNRFALMDADGKVVAYDETVTNPEASDKENLWKVYKKVTEIDNEYSAYLAGDDLTGTVTVAGVGFDAGYNTGLTEVNYNGVGTETHDVVIRTNGGTLTVDAQNDNVNHYGKADSVNIVKVASASYHENGTVPFIQISQGRIELEVTADVNGIHVANIQTVAEDGTVTKTANTFSNDVVLTLNGNDIKLTRDTIGTEIATPVLVCEVQANANSDEYIWLFGDGTIENSKVYVTETKTTPDTSVDSTTTTENASAAAIAIANNATVTTNEETGETTYTAVEAGTSAENAQVASALKGTGTEEDPFLVYDFTTMQMISDFYDKGYYYFAVDMSKTDNGKIDCLNTWAAVKINGSFDGKGVKFINLDWRLFQNIQKDSYIKNLDIVNCNIINTGSIAALANYFTGNTLIENVNISGYIEGQGQTAGYASYCSDGTALITFKDCTLTAKIVAIGGQAGGFMVNPYALANKTGENIGFVIDNSYVEGQLYSTTNDTGYAGSIAYCAYVYAHTIKVPVQFKNIDPDKESLCVNSGSNPSHNNIYWLTNDRSHLITVANPSLDLSDVAFGSTFSLNVSNDVAYATISLLISPNGTDNTGSYTSTYLTETVNSKDGVITSDIVKKYNIAINGSIDGTTMNQVETSETGIANDGTTYNVLSNSYGYTHNGANIFIVLYSASGDVLAYTNTQYISKTGN